MGAWAFPAARDFFYCFSASPAYASPQLKHPALRRYGRSSTYVLLTDDCLLVAHMVAGDAVSSFRCAIASRRPASGRCTQGRADLERCAQHLNVLPFLHRILGHAL